MPSLAPRRWLAAALVPAVLLAPLPGPAAAGDAGPVALILVPAPGLSPRVAETLRDSLLERAGAEGLRLLTGPPSRPPARATVDALRAGLAAGRASYEALDAEAARERLDAVTRALEGEPRLASAASDLLDAPLLLGVVALGLGDASGADAAFERLLRLSPHFRPDAGRYAPAIEHALAAARVRLEALRPARLAVAALPAAAELFVDGVHRGRTPLTLEPLAPGSHALLAQTPEGAAVALTVEATRFGPDLLEIRVPESSPAPALVALARRLSAADGEPDLGPAPGAAIADAVGADTLALVWIEGTPGGVAAAAALLHLSSGRDADRLDLAEAANLSGAADRLAPWIAAAARGEAAPRKPTLLPDWRVAEPSPELDPLAPLAGSPPSEPASGDGRWYRKWYWWALIGAGVAAGAAALASDGGGGGGGTGSVSVTP